LDTYFDKLDADAVTNDFCAACGRKDDLADRQMPDGRWKTTCHGRLAECPR
jgi:hypothetical protein